ncbi:MAG: hypothetical protein P8I51_07010 [Polaribacter sp.]|jgi:hypothetical protein|nr:hypothetical protein [Polaribacter sp.]MDG1954625.1 hypothetical protein [Polaribacter sp.]
MKHRNFLKNKFVIGIMLIMVTIGLTSMKPATVIDPSGVWDYEVETPQGNMTGELTIKNSDGDYAVSIETEQFGTLELGNITLEGNEMTADIDMQGATVEFSFEFDGDAMKGSIATPDGDMDITAKKRSK